MLKWYSNLYIGDNAKKQAKNIIRKINTGAGQLDIYIITLAHNPENHLEIIASSSLLQKTVRQMCPMIVGIAKSREEALSLVTKITAEVYEKTNSANIRTFIKNHHDGA